MKIRVTADDVAKQAGVSQSTVSRVLNNYPYIKKATREKVLAVIEEMGFTRDEIARSLAEKKTRSIGLIVGDISNPFFSESSGVIIGKAQEREYDVILCNTNHSDDNVEKSINTLIGKRVDGIIIASVNRNNTRINALCENGFPVVLYNSSIDDSLANYVVIDNEKGAKAAVDHLVRLGHERIAYISGPQKYLTTYQRLIGYKEALKEHGLRYRENDVYAGEFSYPQIYQFARTLIESKERPTAFLAASDQMALAVMDAIAGIGLNIPDDVSVIGFDNINLAANQYIGLTTVSQQKEKMASIALEMLISLIEKEEGADIPHKMILEPELIVRKTTGPCPK